MKGVIQLCCLCIGVMILAWISWAISYLNAEGSFPDGVVALIAGGIFDAVWLPFEILFDIEMAGLNHIFFVLLALSSCTYGISVYVLVFLYRKWRSHGTTPLFPAFSNRTRRVCAKKISSMKIWF